MTEWLHFHFPLSCIGEGNGNPLQCSCLENPRDKGAWWAAIYGVAQSRTRRKRLSSSSSIPLCVYTHICCCLVTKSWPTLYDPMDCSPPGSSVHRVFQARILEWATISFSDTDIYHVLCISSFIDGHLDCFHILAIVSKCLWILGHLYLLKRMFSLDMCSRVELLDYMVVLSVVF